MVVHLIGNHATVVLDPGKGITMTKMEGGETVVGVEIENEGVKEVAESAQVKVEEVEVKRDPKKDAAGAENGVINVVEVEVKIAESEAEVMKEKEVAAKKEVAFVVLVAVVLEEGLLRLPQRHGLEADLDVLEVDHQLTYH